MKAGVLLDILYDCHFTLMWIFHGSNCAMAASFYLSNEYRDLPGLTGYDIRWCSDKAGKQTTLCLKMGCTLNFVLKNYPKIKEKHLSISFNIFKKQKIQLICDFIKGTCYSSELKKKKKSYQLVIFTTSQSCPYDNTQQIWILYL